MLASRLLVDPAKGFRRASPSFSAHVRWGERGAPVQRLMPSSGIDRSPAELGVAFSEVVMPFAHVSGYSLHNITGVKENNRLS
jgi:hypothetical protein